MTDSPINRKTLEHLTELARIELKAGEEEKLLKDLEKILDHFKELRTLDTEKVEPMAGGTSMKNAFREDEERRNTHQGAGVQDFPETQSKFLKTPPIFE